MNNLFKYNSNLRYRIVGKINGLADEVKHTRSLAAKRIAKKKDISQLDSRKRLIGEDTRHHLLAYAFMRGTPYRALERACRDDNKPYASWILKIVLLHYPYDAIITLDKVQAWLDAKE